MRQCRLCTGYFDESGLLIEVSGYSECFDCLRDDPEIAAELQRSHPNLFNGEFHASHYAEKAKQAAAYLEGGEAENADHPDHQICISRALDRARDIVKACENYLEIL